MVETAVDARLKARLASPKASPIANKRLHHRYKQDDDE